MPDQTTDTKTRQKAIKDLRELIKDIHVAMLTTVSDEGQLRSRPMITARLEFDGMLWFFTLDNDGKADEIKERPRVNLAYADPGSHRYVSVTGSATLVHDAKKAELLWTEELRDWFPVGPSDPDLALIQVDVEEAEYWDSKVNRLASVVKGLFFASEKEAEARQDRLAGSGFVERYLNGRSQLGSRESQFHEE